MENKTEEKEQQVVVVTCPHCGKSVELLAECYNLDKMVMPVVVVPGLAEGRPVLDWSQIDAEGDFVYVCPECKELIAYDLEEVYGWLLHGEHNAHLE